MRILRLRPKEEYHNNSHYQYGIIGNIKYHILPIINLSFGCFGEASCFQSVGLSFFQTHFFFFGAAFRPGGRSKHQVGRSKSLYDHSKYMILIESLFKMRNKNKYIEHDIIHTTNIVKVEYMYLKIIP